MKQSQSMLQKALERSNALPKVSERWQPLVEDIGNFIMSDLQPLSVVDNVGFKRLMHTGGLHSFQGPVLAILYKYSHFSDVHL